MTREPPAWNPDRDSATVLMEYIKRASPQFVAAELDRLDLLDAADRAAASILGRLDVGREWRGESLLSRKLAAVVALAMCVTILAIAQIRHPGAMSVLPEDDGAGFMQLAGPTPEW
ncbi:MAG TPA: hypothetical protein VFO35_15160 [Steroidobacteraceae bacterium]|nr:hypothetical protein [Steroidobacteraceae bacterium]